MMPMQIQVFPGWVAPFSRSCLRCVSMLLFRLLPWSVLARPAMIKKIPNTIISYLRFCFGDTVEWIVLKRMWDCYPLSLIFLSAFINLPPLSWYVLILFPILVCAGKWKLRFVWLLLRCFWLCFSDWLGAYYFISGNVGVCAILFRDRRYIINIAVSIFRANLPLRFFGKWMHIVNRALQIAHCFVFLGFLW